MIPETVNPRSTVARPSEPVIPLHVRATPRHQAPTGPLSDRSERVAQVAAALSQLPAGEQIVLDLLYRQEFRVREVSQVLGISECRVARLRTRARGRLRGMLRSGAAAGQASGAIQGRIPERFSADRPRSFRVA